MTSGEATGVGPADAVGTVGIPARITVVVGRVRALSSPLTLVAVWFAAAVYELRRLHFGWIGHDEGTVAQSAERVLLGELPHRDFGELYTGGLSYLHALMFLLFGMELSSLRLLLFAFFLAWIPVVYWIARRFASPLVSGAVVLLCVVWTVPNYSASLPSWYNLFLATFAAAAVLRFLDVGGGRWLFAAGLSCGLSLAIKSTGSFALVAVLVALVYVEQTTERPRRALVRVSSYSLAVVGLGAAVALFLAAVLRPRLGPAEVVDFLLPGTAVAAFLVWNELRVARPRARERFATLARLWAPFLAGGAVPLALLALPYLLAGALGDLVRGVVIEPAARIEFAAFAPPTALALAVPALAVLTAVAVAACSVVTQRAAIAILGATLLLWLVPSDPDARRMTWVSVHASARILVPAALVLLALRIRRGRRAGAELEAGTVLLLALAALCAVVQFPFAAEIYFSYVVPLVFLAALALWSLHAADRPRPFLSAALTLLLAFGVLWGVLRLDPAYANWSGRANEQARTLAVDRAGSIRVPPGEASVYERITALVSEHGRGEYVLAGPDCPEIPFLVGRRSATPWLFDFFAEPAARDRAVVDALGARDITVVVLNRRPAFSPPFPASLMRTLRARYPHGRLVGRFEVRWRA